MPNVKVQGPNEVQRPNKKKNEEEWNDGTLDYRIEQNNPWIRLHYLGIILSNFSHFGWHVPRKPRLAGGVKGHNTMKLPLLASGSPLRAREAPPCGRGASHSFDI